MEFESYKLLAVLSFLVWGSSCFAQHEAEIREAADQLEGPVLLLKNGSSLQTLSHQQKIIEKITLPDETLQSREWLDHTRTETARLIELLKTIVELANKDCSKKKSFAALEALKLLSTQKSLKSFVQLQYAKVLGHKATGWGGLRWEKKAEAIAALKESGAVEAMTVVTLLDAINKTVSDGVRIRIAALIQTLLEKYPAVFPAVVDRLSETHKTRLENLEAFYRKQVEVFSASTRINAGTRLQENRASLNIIRTLNDTLSGGNNQHTDIMRKVASLEVVSSKHRSTFQDILRIGIAGSIDLSEADSKLIFDVAGADLKDPKQDLYSQESIRLARKILAAHSLIGSAGLDLESTDFMLQFSCAKSLTVPKTGQK